MFSVPDTMSIAYTHSTNTHTHTNSRDLTKTSTNYKRGKKREPELNYTCFIFTVIFSLLLGRLQFIFLSICLHIVHYFIICSGQTCFIRHSGFVEYVHANINLLNKLFILYVFFLVFFSLFGSLSIRHQNENILTIKLCDSPLFFRPFCYVAEV